LGPVKSRASCSRFPRSRVAGRRSRMSVP